MAMPTLSNLAGTGTKATKSRSSPGSWATLSTIMDEGSDLNEVSADSSGLLQLGHPVEQVVGIVVASTSSTLSLTLSSRRALLTVVDEVGAVGAASSDGVELMAPMDALSWRSSVDVAGASSWRSPVANAAAHSA